MKPQGPLTHTTPQMVAETEGGSGTLTDPTREGDESGCNYTTLISHRDVSQTPSEENTGLRYCGGRADIHQPRCSQRKCR